MKLPNVDRLNNFPARFFFNAGSWRILASVWHYCVPIHTHLFKILCFSYQGKSRDIVYQCIGLFFWLIFAQHGLFVIQLTVFSALSLLTDLGIYYITRCRIWLLTIFHIPYVHFQRQLRKVTSPKLYLSFFVQYTNVYMSCKFNLPSSQCWTSTIGLTLHVVFKYKFYKSSK